MLLGRSGGSSALTTVRLVFAISLFLFSSSLSRVEVLPKDRQGVTNQGQQPYDEGLAAGPGSGLLQVRRVESPGSQTQGSLPAVLPPPGTVAVA